MKTAVIVNDHAVVNGGQAKVAVETALALRGGGLEVIFFSGVGPADPRLEKAGVRCICLNQFDMVADPVRARSAVRGIWNQQAARELGSLLRTLDPKSSVVHVHGWAKSLSPSIGPIITAGPVPHVYTLHEYFLACPNGGFYDYQHKKICSRRPLGLDCLTTHCDPRSQSHKAWRVARQVTLWTAGCMPSQLQDFIYLTDTQLRAIREYLPAKARLHLLPNPVQRTVSERVPAEENDTFLFLGRLSPEKGGELAAKAARCAEVRIAFAGEGDCRASIASANPYAQMLGWLDPEQLENQMRQARCLIFPSLWYEGYPMSVVEAMQRGLPVIASDRTAATEIVRHDVDGLHVRTGDLNAWVGAMKLCKERERIARYSRSSFEGACRFLETETYKQRLLEIYDKAAWAQRSAVLTG
ncbi:MAG: glycosyltransferase [Rhizobiales bacterium]|nr:glycosyltransferase [Hyphomicrobiales bacterium]